MRQEKHLEHTVYRKPTHTSRYLNAASHHHPSQIQAVANTLITRSIRLTNTHTRKHEINKITEELQKNKYSNRTIQRAMQQQQKPRIKQQENNWNMKQAIFPYIKGTTKGYTASHVEIATKLMKEIQIGAYLLDEKNTNPV